MMGSLLVGLAAQSLLVPIQTTLPPPAPLVQPAPLQPYQSGLTSPVAALQRELDRIAALPSGEIGVAVVDLTTGRTVSVNGTRAFPMASTVKLAVAAHYLAEVEAGHRSLDRMIPVSSRLRLRSDGITFFSPHDGVTLSAANLIELMITRSDNTATDVLLADLGGPSATQAWLRRKDVTDLRIDRNIAELLLDRRGARATGGSTAAMTLRRWDPVSPGSVSLVTTEESAPEQASAVFDRDPRDTATPLGFATFLRRLYNGQLLKPQSRDFLFGVMGRTLTGANRIKGLLPPATPVEHKTGTLSTHTSDVGFVVLPNGRRLIVTAFARGGSNRSAVIARAARAAYDAFAFAP